MKVIITILLLLSYTFLNTLEKIVMFYSEVETVFMFHGGR